MMKSPRMLQIWHRANIPSFDAFLSPDALERLWKAGLRTVRSHFVDREEGKDRLVMNASFPLPTSVWDSLLVNGHQAIQINENEHNQRGEHLTFDWPSVESISEVLSIY